MIHKLVLEDHNYRPKVKNITAFGGFNELPSPCIEINQDEYCHLRGMQCVQATEFRQVSIPEGKIGQPIKACELKPGSPAMKSVYIDYYYTYVLIVVLPNNWTCSNPEKTGYSIKYSDPIRYFRCGQNEVPDWVHKYGTE